ncbi:MAG: hypothetical protein GEV10_19550 [Streptosporangiales bacterium]|nr:hypothetical protein [Streptosporangiales bacterium]
MALTYYTLRDLGLSSTSFTYGFGFDLAELHISTTRYYFEQVKERIDAGHAWSGDGRGAADKVLHLNSLALATSETQMSAGKTAVQALGLALTRARDEAKTALEPIEKMAEGTPFRILVGADGRVGPVVEGPKGPDFNLEYSDLSNYLYKEAEVAQLKLESILTFARSADLAAATLFNRIYHLRPVFSATASSDAIEYNEALHDIAKQNLSLAEFTYQLWNGISSEDLLEVQPQGWSWWGAIKGAFIPESAEELAYETGWGLIKAGLGTVYPFFQKAISVHGKYEMIDGWFKGGHHGPSISDPDIPDLLSLNPVAHHSDLQGKVEEFYGGYGSLTVAQLAKLQSLGQLEDDGHDYVADAEELWSWLNGWIDANPPVFPESSPDPLTPEELDLLRDWKLAFRLARELDAAIH